MRIELNLNKSVNENASIYFNRAKKARKKIEGAKKALEIFHERLRKVRESANAAAETEPEEKKLRKKEWYEKFRWFHTSDGFLVIGGRDATTNEIIIKKHTEPHDLVFHTDMAGSPFFVLKTEGRPVSDEAIEQVADTTASYSRAWRMGIGSSDVFYVTPEQVSKEAQSGEFVAKGAFIIRGKTTHVKNKINVAIGVKDGVIIYGPIDAVKAQTESYVVLKQTSDNIKTSDTAKKVRRILKSKDLDEIIRALPPGPCIIAD